MRKMMKSMMTETITKLIVEYNENNPKKDAFFKNLAIKSVLVNSNESYKRSLVKDKHKFQMSESEINELVDEVTNELYHKFLN